MKISFKDKDNTRKADDSVLKEAAKAIEKSRQLLKEDEFTGLPSFLTDPPDWMPNILGPGAAGTEGISLKDKECNLTPEMMDIIAKKHPEIDMTTKEGWDAACKLGGMTPEQYKEETQEYFQTGLGAVETALALGLLLPLAPAAPAAAEVGAVAQVASKTPGMLRRIIGSKWGPFSWRYEVGMMAAAYGAPEFYDKVLKYADPWHYAINLLRLWKIAPYIPLIGDDECPRFGDECWPGWTDSNDKDGGAPLDEEDKELAEQLAEIVDAEIAAYQAGNMEEAERINTLRLGVEQKIREKGAVDYTAAAAAVQEQAPQATIPVAAEEETIVAYTPDNPYILNIESGGEITAEMVEQMKADYVRILNGKDPQPGDEEFLKLFVYGN